MDWKKSIVTSLTVFVSITVIYILVIFVAFGGLSCVGSSIAPPPEIQLGEFPFRLEYEVDEEIFVVEDVLVVEFDGNDWDAGRGTHPTWRGFVASGRERIILFADDEVEIFIRAVRSDWALRQLMGEGAPGWNINLDVNTTFPATWRTTDGETREIFSNDLYNTYNIRIISWEIAPPIENTFRYSPAP